MSRALRIAAEEWRLWRRSRLAATGLAVFMLVLIATSVLTTMRMDDERQQRQLRQVEAEAAFLAQPDRHPHRMVHYGHYVFRTPPPLAAFEPGVDAVTGQSLFLEGHRQNASMFADARAAANTGGFGRLTPALAYQILLPLLLIALGHAAMLREREAGTLAPLLAQGVSGRDLFLGKTLALAALTVLMLLPAGLAGAWALLQGEAVSVVLGLLALYAGYLLLWVVLIVLVSSALGKRSLALGLLVLVWLAWALLLPRLGVVYASASVPSASKIQTDLEMQAEQHSLADGHNANDPAFAKLRSSLLEQYAVERVEDLPVNIRGVVSSHAEAALTRVLNEYAERHMASERQQANHLARFGWLSPALALASASRALAGTDLATHHRFLREAEDLRFGFVQRLNDVHANELRYSDDINRSRDPDAERRTRVSAEHWNLLSKFRFEAATPAERLANARRHLWPLLCWFGVCLLAGLTAAARLRP